MNTIALPSDERRVLVRSLWLSLAGLSALTMIVVAVWPSIRGAKKETRGDSEAD